MTRSNSTIPRRTVLKTVGAALSLPYMESLAAAATTPNEEPPVRFLGMYQPNGVNPYKWYPTTAGRDYEMPENLALLSDLRDDMTVTSGLAHFRCPQSAGHSGVSNLLTGVGNGGGKKFSTSVSLDQYLAPHIGQKTRYESLSLSWKTGVGALSGHIHTMSYGLRGNPIPAESSPRRIFEQLFVEPSEQAKGQIRHLQGRNQSILDNLREQASGVNRRLGKRDQQKLDEYLTNVRSVEAQMQRSDKWLNTPRHEVDPKTGKLMLDADRHDHDLMLDLIYLALVSDTTRVISYVQMTEPGLYHKTSHWNKDPDRLLPEMDVWDRKWLTGLARLVGKMKQTEEGDGNLLGRTAIVYGNGHGRRPHYSHDLPILLLGGGDLGIKHGQHLAFQPLEEANPKAREKAEDQNKRRAEFVKTPLCNMFVSVANALGVPTEKFADSTGPLDGLA